MSNQQNDSVINWSMFKKPVVLNANQWGTNYLFKAELDRAFERIENFQKLHNNFMKNDKRKDSEEEFDVPMNLAIIGERGSGKTSILKSLKNKLEAENYYVFDIIDPNTLSSEINILEILVSQIYSQICDMELEDLYQKEDMICLLKRIMTVLSIKRQKDNFLKKDNPSIDVLDKIKDLVKLDELIVKLFKCFRQMLSREKGNDCEHKIKDLVLIIDDLDLVENQYIYKLISEIQEFLNSKLIIVLAFRNKQLDEAVLSHKVARSKDLINVNYLSLEELIRQVTVLLYKLIPVGNRIYLYDQVSLLSIHYREIFISIGIDKLLEDSGLEISYIDETKRSRITVEEWIYLKIREITGIYIKPVDDKETVKLFLPGSLREFIQLCEILSFCIMRMRETISGDITYIDMYKIRIINILEFKKYFINKVFGIVPLDFIDLVQNWDFVESHQKNYLCYHFFLKLFDKEWRESNREIWKNRQGLVYPFNLSRVENHNLRLGDVYEIMELYKIHCAKSSIDFFTVYVMKVLYSIELTKLIYSCESHVKFRKDGDIEDKELDNIEDLQRYLNLINTSFVPMDLIVRNYNKAWNEEDFWFQYNPQIHDEQFISQLVSSDMAAKGDQKNSIFKVKEEIQKTRSGFRYRYVYSYNELKLIKNHSYRIEYFAVFGKEEYLVNALFHNVSIKRNNNKLDGIYFLLSSMFQVDWFVRHNYTKNEQGENFSIYEYIKDRVNDILKEKIQENKEERCYFTFNNTEISGNFDYPTEKDLKEKRLNDNNGYWYIAPLSIELRNFESTKETEEQQKETEEQIDEDKLDYDFYKVTIEGETYGGLKFCNEKKASLKMEKTLNTLKEALKELDDEAIELIDQILKLWYKENIRANKETYQMVSDLKQIMQDKYQLEKEED